MPLKHKIAHTVIIHMCVYPSATLRYDLAALAVYLYVYIMPLLLHLLQVAPSSMFDMAKRT